LIHSDRLQREHEPSRSFGGLAPDSLRRLPRGEVQRVRFEAAE
jgi:hypothetical protein